MATPNPLMCIRALTWRQWRGKTYTVRRKRHTRARLTRCICPDCRRGSLSAVRKRPLNTCYPDGHSNYVRMCLYGWRELWRMYEDQWAEYNASRI